jgi:glycosyltransferase involved in cell wall biosynthesis
VEAMAAGTPVIGLRSGGVAETVADEVSGVLVESFSSDSALRYAIDRVGSLGKSGIIARAWEFDEQHFDKRIRRWILGND